MANGPIGGMAMERYRIGTHLERVKVDIQLVITSLYWDILPSHVIHHGMIYA